MQNRRRFLKNTAAATTATTLFPALAGSGCSPGTEQSKQNSRKKRIIWNNDADDLAGIAQGLGRRPHWPKRFETVDEYLALRMNHLKGTHVNGLAHCGLATIPHWELPRKNISALGPDPVQPAVKFAHDNKLEFFFSIRMNDVHCAVYSGIQYWTPLKLENPDLLQSRISRERFQETFLPWINGESADHPHDALLEYWGNGGRRTIDRFRNSSLGPISFSWPAYDYARPEVRDHFLGVVREACRRYDLEGIELDWCRHPLL
ncbi:MAG: twin-arginine translocation signal domain-containing protein, partial [Candidatus Aminicenantes bacterium]|nr:twin-arginine translocation signal domain-containing protein [Candidatus Aminicenantes bacterium]